MFNYAKKCVKNTKLGAVIALIIAFVIFYLGPNHLSIFTARALPLSNWEKSIPLLPWTIIFYLVAYLQVIIILCYAGQRSLHKILKGMIGLIVFHGLFFFFFPTYYPRPFFPPEADFFTNLGYRLIVFFDKPTNCFPSLHVALSLYSTLVLWKKSSNIKIISLIIFLLTVISTLTIKQHYFLDILGGMFTAIIFYTLFVYDARRKNRSYLQTN